MAQFQVRHMFKNISRDEYESLYFDEAFNEALCEAVNLAREVRSIDRTPERIARVIAVGPDREIPKPVQKIVGAARLDYEEHLAYEFGTFKGTWETIPSVMAKKVNTKGTFAFEEATGGVERIVQGTIEVKVLGIGKVVEKFIIADVEKSYEDAARFTQQWIDAGKHQS